MADGNRLFVGGLGSDVSKEQLGDLFSEHGQVDDAYVNPSGYGFVTFSDSDSAGKAVTALNGFEFMGRNIRVEVSKPRDGGRGGGRGGGSGGGGGYGGGRSDAGGNKLYVGSLSQDVSKDDLETAFAAHGEIESVWIAGNPGGFGFVTFVDNASAQNAVGAMDGVVLGGQSIRVQVSRPKGEGGSRGGGRGGGGGGGYRGGRGGGSNGGGGYGYSQDNYGGGNAPDTESWT